MRNLKIRKTWDHAAELGRKVEALDLTDDITVFGPQILAIFAGHGEEFMLLDEKIGLFSRNSLNDRYCLMRRVRNHPTWGRQLFASFR